MTPAFDSFAANISTEDYVEVGIWSTIEVPVGVMCACMPSIRALFRDIFPGMFGTTNRDRRSMSVTLSSTPQIKSKSEYANLSKHEHGSSVIGLVNMDTHPDGYKNPV